MFKCILSVLGGAAVGVFTIGAVQYTGHWVYPVPADINLQDPSSMAKYLATAPIGALLLVLLAYAMGSLLGGMVAARYATSKKILHAVLAGFILQLFGVANLWQIQHPFWSVVASVLLYLPMAFFGGTMSSRHIP